MRKGLPDPTPAAKVTIVTKGLLRRCGSERPPFNSQWSSLPRFARKPLFRRHSLPYCYDPTFSLCIRPRWRLIFARDGCWGGFAFRSRPIGEKYEATLYEGTSSNRPHRHEERSTR
jgi:hypothetical protein